MSTYFSASSVGFYITEVHGNNRPGDCVQISEEAHAALLEGQSRGLRIIAGIDGVPTLATFQEP